MQWFSSSCKAQCNWLNTQTQKKGLNKSFAILSYSSFFLGGGVWASTCHITFVKNQQTQPTALLLKSNPGHFGGGHVPLPTLYNFINCTLIVSNLSMHFWTSWTRKLILIVFHKALVFQSFFFNIPLSWYMFLHSYFLCPWKLINKK